jgi:hypothetical protein
MDLKGILRAYRYNHLEQTPDPKTGARRIPPSIKFGAILFLLGALTVGYIASQAAHEPTASGSGPLGTDDDPDPTPTNNTTGPTPAPARGLNAQESPTTPVLIALAANR